MRIPRLIFAVVAAVVVLSGLYWLFPRQNHEPRRSRTSTATITGERSGVVAESVVTAALPATTPTTDREKSIRTPAATLARIMALKIVATDPHSIRRLLVELERLRELEGAALPLLQEFLASGQDADYITAFGKVGFRGGKVPTDFTVPPSLRLALLEVVKNIGGPEAEAVLARELRSTGRGVEAAYLTAVLQQIAPDKYRDVSIAAARDLLAMPLSPSTKNLLDRSDREYLYDILAVAGDRSQVAQAEAQLLLPDGSVDRGALRYLQQTMGEDAVAVAIRAWADPSIPPQQREPLARLALNYVGVSARAEQLYQAAINDPNLSPSARKNLIEDLNQDGFANLKQLSATDLPLIERRLALIEQLVPRTKDAVNITAFAEAKKDLLSMRDRAQQSKSANK